MLASKHDMKHLLLTTIAAVLLVGCGESQQSAPSAEAKPANPVAEAKPVNPKANKALLNAFKKGDIEAAKQAITDGADVNGKDKWGQTSVEGAPLHQAVNQGRQEIIELLIAKSADVNVKDMLFNFTALDWAVKLKKTVTIKLLHKHGGKSAAQDSIHIAASLGNIEAVKKHLAAGTDVNAKDQNGKTPLHYAAWKGHKEIAELLIANGADVNAKDDKGGTPLHVAAWEGHTEVAELFIAKGADVNAKMEDGDTPLDLAKRHPETADLLRKHGGKTAEELKAEGK